LTVLEALEMPLMTQTPSSPRFQSICWTNCYWIQHISIWDNDRIIHNQNGSMNLPLFLKTIVVSITTKQKYEKRKKKIQR